MASIAHTAFECPPLRAVRGCIAEQRAVTYGYLFEPSATAAVPFGRQDLLFGSQAACPEFEPYCTASDRMVPVAAADRTAGDLAVNACLALAAKLPPGRRESITDIILCHESIDEATAGSTAALLQGALALDGTVPFSVSQLSNCSAFLALDIASSLVAGDSSVLVAATDKWLYPFFRGFGPNACFGDGAGAVLVVGGHERNLRIVAIKVRSADDGWTAYGHVPFASSDRFVEKVCATIADCLTENGLDPAAIDLIVPQNFAPRLVAAVASRMGLGCHRHHVGRRGDGHCGSADTLIALGEICADEIPFNTALFWGAGMNGETAAMLLQRIRPAGISKRGSAL